MSPPSYRNAWVRLLLQPLQPGSRLGHSGQRRRGMPPSDPPTRLRDRRTDASRAGSARALLAGRGDLTGL